MCSFQSGAFAFQPQNIFQMPRKLFLNCFFFNDETESVFTVTTISLTKLRFTVINITISLTKLIFTVISITISLAGN